MSYKATNLLFQYNNKESKNEAFKLGPLNFEIPSGKITFICGRSGSGKSTLLAILGLLRTEFSGELLIFDDNSKNLIQNKDELYEYRLNNIGFALQKGRLLPYLTVKENSEFILDYLNIPSKEKNERSQEVFGKLFKLEKDEDEKSYTRVLNSYPESVSGGQYQRAALARALINSPSIILADEPTGNLDVNTGEKTMDLLKDYLTEQDNSTVIIVSHDLEYARLYADKIIILKKGEISASVIKIKGDNWKTEDDNRQINKLSINQFLNSKIKDDE